MTLNELLEKGKELNRLHSDYKNAVKYRDGRQKWKLYYEAAEQYRIDFGKYLKSNPTDISKLL